MTRTAADIQAEITDAKSRLAALEAELAALEAEQAEQAEQAEDDRLNAMAAAAHDLLATTETIAPATKYGPTARRAADKGVITRKFNATLKVWGGDYNGLRSYAFMYRAEYPTAMRYLMADHLAR